MVVGVTEGLEVRPAEAADADLVAEVVFGDPDQMTRRVAAALYGVDDPEVLRPLFRAVAIAGESWRRTHVGVVTDPATGHDAVAGIVQLGPSETRITPKVAVAAMGALGVRALAAPRAMRLAARVAPTYPADALIVSELHVAPGFRGRGIGGSLLTFAEAEAVRTGRAQVALHTFTTNPARSLYERSGYRVVAEVTDADFERRTGVAGNVLYVKDVIDRR
jgi:ribosomal protein S18 acetylase RimI-like enzyme